MPIYFMNTTSSVGQGSNIKSKDFIQMRNKFTPKELEKLVDFLNNAITRTSFSVTTKFPNPWPDELALIYDKFDYELSKRFLGCLVWEILCGRDDAWFATKTKLPNHQDREYESIFYSPIEEEP